MRRLPSTLFALSPLPAPGAFAQQATGAEAARADAGRAPDSESVR